MSEFTNPVSGAIAIGLGNAVGTSIGASIRNNNLHDETITNLTGGVITGAIAGLFACCLPKIKEDSDSALKFSVGVLHSSIALAASLTAPLMGEALLHYGTEWSEVVIDDLIGGATLLGGGVALVAALGAVTLGQNCFSFFSRANTNTNTNIHTHEHEREEIPGLNITPIPV